MSAKHKEAGLRQMVLLKWHLSRAAKAAALQNMREGMAWEKIHSEWTRKVELLVEERNIILESEKEMSATNLAMLEAEGRVRMEALESKYQEEIALVQPSKVVTLGSSMCETKRRSQP